MEIQTDEAKALLDVVQNASIELKSVRREWFGDCVGEDLRPSPGLSPYVCGALSLVRWLVSGVDTCDFRKRELFQEAMWTLGSLGVAEQELSELFSTTPNTVNRWMNGRSAPSPVLRKFIVLTGLELLRRHGMKIASRRFDPITGGPK